VAEAPVNRLQATLSRAAAELDRLHHPWALIGGLAVSARLGPRFTRDIDLAVAVPDDAEAEQLIFRLQQVGFRVESVLEQDAVGRLATVRLLAPREPPEGVVVDLLFSSSGIEPEICRDADRLQVFEGLTVPVCRPEHLLALKVLARDDIRRPQDIIDIRSLLDHLGPEGRARARDALALIVMRGYQRQRDLLSAFEALVAEDSGAQS